MPPSTTRKAAISITAISPDNNKPYIGPALITASVPAGGGIELYAPFTSYDGSQAVGQSWGMGGMEPLGRFRAGPIGTAFKENDLFIRVNYKF